MDSMARADKVFGPSSSIGILRFTDSEKNAPKLSPEFVVIVCAIVIIAVMVLQSFG